MVGAVPDILARIVAHKREELARAEVSREEWERRGIDRISGRRDFVGSIRAKARAFEPAIIAEIKKASPSRGLLAAEFNPPAIARAYEQGGAAGLSVLTDERFFQGSLSDLGAARRATSLAALRKDFTIDPYHVAEAAAHDADAILLIATLLTPAEMRRLREYAAMFRMAALVEVHDETELAAAADSGAEIIGVNNRDLRTFAVSLDTSLRLAEKMPQGVIKISESGIESAEDLRRLRAAGFDAFLVGEHLMKSGDPAAAVRALTA
jgi:indole-3-glycerol phosphate synthase